MSQRRGAQALAEAVAGLRATMQDDGPTQAQQAAAWAIVGQRARSKVGRAMLRAGVVDDRLAGWVGDDPGPRKAKAAAAVLAVPESRDVRRRLLVELAGVAERLAVASPEPAPWVPAVPEPEPEAESGARVLPFPLGCSCLNCRSGAPGQCVRFKPWGFV